jgi:hypothetical protein
MSLPAAGVVAAEEVPPAEIQEMFVQATKLDNLQPGVACARAAGALAACAFAELDARVQKVHVQCA